MKTSENFKKLLWCCSMDYSRSITLLLRWKRERSGGQRISTVKFLLECFAKALQIAWRGASGCPQWGGLLWNVCVEAKENPSLLGRRLVPTWPVFPEKPSTVAGAICPVLLGDILRGCRQSPQAQMWEMPSSPLTHDCNHLHYQHKIPQRRNYKVWPGPTCSRASWLCSYPVLEGSPEQIPACQQHGNSALLRRATPCLSACATFCSAVGDLVGKWEQPESDTAAATDSKCGWIPIPNTRFPWLCPFPQHWPSCLLLCCLPLWKLALRVGNI